MISQSDFISHSNLVSHLKLNIESNLVLFCLKKVEIQQNITYSVSLLVAGESMMLFPISLQSNLVSQTLKFDCDFSQ